MPEQPAADDDPASPRGCCVSFWGSFRPFIGGHTAIECGSSLYLPTSILLLYRVAAFLFLFAVDLYLVVRGIYRPQYYTILGSAIITFSFLILAICSALLIRKRTSLLEKTANVVVPFHFIAGASALYLTPVYYTILEAIYFNWWNAILHGGTLALFVGDFALGAAMAPKLSYVLLFVVFNLAYLAFVWIRYFVGRSSPDFEHLYPFFDHSTQSSGEIAVLYMALVVGTFITGLLTFLISRITFCCGARNRRL